MVIHVNDLIDGINISKIIHSKISCEYFPAPKVVILNTGTTYKYSPTILSKVIKYKEVAENINVQAQCIWKDYSEFTDQYLSHVITGSLEIIENKEVKTSFKKGLTF